MSFQPFETIEGAEDRALLLVADHAMRHLPGAFGRLGLPAAEFDRHIAYDIGIEPLTRALAARLGVPAVMARFSRLLIDPNRGEDDPTLIRQIYDRAVVPGNAVLTPDERAGRIDAFHRPYHAAVSAALRAVEAASGRPPLVVSLHSFTPVMGGIARPWHCGLLWDADPRAAAFMIAALGAEPGLVVGDNEPYDGALNGDTMYRHCSADGLAHALIEVRQDLIGDESGVAEWTARLAPVIAQANARAGMHERRHFGSRAGPLERREL